MLAEEISEGHLKELIYISEYFVPLTLTILDLQKSCFPRKVLLSKILVSFFTFFIKPFKPAQTIARLR